MNTPGRLVLVPVSLGETDWQHFLPTEAHAAFSSITDFVVENPKTARAQLKRLAHPLAIADLRLTPLPEQGGNAALDALLAPALAGHDVGLMSDAGCPGVADPGARLVARAHALGITVQPLVGPSSILLSLMASGLNGQRFAFEGYLPVAEAERDRRIRTLDDESRRLGRTQIFIETPYRNDRLFDALLAHCRPDTRLCVARDLNTPDEWIRTLEVAAWQRADRPALARRPAIFLILAQR